jgi:hypothetical protein
LLHCNTCDHNTRKNQDIPLADARDGKQIVRRAARFTKVKSNRRFSASDRA